MKRVKDMKVLLIALGVCWLAVGAMADQAKPAKAAPADLATAKPGRDPNQAIDE